MVRNEDAGCGQVLDVSACRACGTRVSLRAERRTIVLSPRSRPVPVPSRPPPRAPHTSCPRQQQVAQPPVSPRAETYCSPLTGGWNFFSEFLSQGEKNMTCVARIRNERRNVLRGRHFSAGDSLFSPAPHLRVRGRTGLSPNSIRFPRQLHPVAKEAGLRG